MLVKKNGQSGSMSEALFFLAGWVLSKVTYDLLANKWIKNHKGEELLKEIRRKQKHE